MQSNNIFVEHFRQNPDNIAAFYRLSELTNSLWIYDTSTSKARELLDLSASNYSSPVPFFSETSPEFFVPTHISNYCHAATSLAPFLIGSFSKQDILKPYSPLNQRTLAQLSALQLQNATVICSPLSILVLNSDDQIISEVSHNSPESLFVWYKHNKSRLHLQELQDAVMISVQQTFNLGHWFIDALPRLQLYLSIADRYQLSKKPVVLLDTNTHPLIQASLSYFGIFNSIPTLPFSAFKISSLIIPLVPSFDNRVSIGTSLVKSIFPKKDLSHELPKKIYLSRQKLDRRFITNHHQLESLLDSFGYTTIHPQEYDLRSIHTLISNASHVVGPNGAAFCNLLFSRTPKVGILYPSSHLDDYYFRVSSALKCPLSLQVSGEFKTMSYHQMLRKYYFPDVQSSYYVEPTFFEELLASLL